MSESFVAMGFHKELEKTPHGWSLDFQDGISGEWWVAIRKADMEELLDKVEPETVDSSQEATHA